MLPMFVCLKKGAELKRFFVYDLALFFDDEAGSVSNGYEAIGHDAVVPFHSIR